MSRSARGGLSIICVGMALGIFGAIIGADTTKVGAGIAVFGLLVLALGLHIDD